MTEQGVSKAAAYVLRIAVALVAAISSYSPENSAGFTVRGADPVPDNVSDAELLLACSTESRDLPSTFALLLPASCL
jgi:hypothetical protein